jgi:hypothetical protein
MTRICHCALNEMTTFRGVVHPPILITKQCEVCELDSPIEFNEENVQKAFNWFRLQFETLSEDMLEWR